MTLHPCPDDFFQDFVLVPFQSSSLSSLSDSSLSSLGGHRCIDVALALHCQCLLRCPEVLTEIYFQNFNQSKWHNTPLYFAVCLQIHIKLTLQFIQIHIKPTLQFVFKFTSNFPYNLFFAICLQIHIKLSLQFVLCNLSSNSNQARYNLTQHNHQRVDME